MNNSHLKVVAVILVLFLLTGLITVGCKQKTKSAWVNTNSMPGNTFKSHTSEKSRSSKVIYLGSNDNRADVNFGPQDVNFEFRNLRR